MAKIQPDEWMITPAPHLGDTYFTCALTEAHLQRNGGSLVRIVVPKKLWSLLKIFPGTRVAPIDPDDVPVAFRQTGSASLLHPYFSHVDEFWNYARLEDQEGERIIAFHASINFRNFFELKYMGRTFPFTKSYHELLELPFPSFARPSVSPEIRADAEERLRKLDLPFGRTVILVPFTKSLTPFSEHIWNDLSAAFKAKGYVVATNVSVDQLHRCVPGTIPLACPPEELIPIAELAGTVVASRCGVCDILSSARTDLRILYQKSYLEWSPMPKVKLECDLGPCGLEDHASYFRMGDSEPESEFIERIVSLRK
jgi:hypothetical protein